MTGRQGRVYSKKAQVAVGNGNGVIGFGAASSPDFVSAVRKAKTKAEKRLQLIERLILCSCCANLIFYSFFLYFFVCNNFHL